MREKRNAVRSVARVSDEEKESEREILTNVSALHV